MILYKNNTTLQGSVGVHAAMFYFSALGYHCHTSSVDTSEIDLIIEKDKNLIKVQVKTTTMQKNNKYIATLVGTRGYTDNKNKTVIHRKSIDLVDFDLLFILTASFDCFVFSKNEIGKRKAITLPTKNTLGNYVGRVWVNDCPSVYDNIQQQTISTKKPRNRDKCRLFNPTKDELYDSLVSLNFNFSAVGRKYGVSGQSIKKRMKLFGIKSPYV